MDIIIAVLLCALISTLFVLSLYVWDIHRILRGAPPANRDEPRVVCQRITSVLGSSLASGGIVAAAAKYGLLNDSHAPLPSLPRLLSLQPDYLLPSLLYPLLLVALLFLGPLTLAAAEGLQALAAEWDTTPQAQYNGRSRGESSGIDGDGEGGDGVIAEPLLSQHQQQKQQKQQKQQQQQQKQQQQQQQRYLLRQWHAVTWRQDLLLHTRNLVVAPISEEFVFRTALCPLLLAGGFSVTSLVFICPLFFSLAHVHHVWNLVHYHRCSLPRALAMMAFTWVFGCLAAFILLRTGSVWAAIAAHAFCNFMGVPDFQAALTHQHKYAMGSAFVAGIILFITFLNTLTDPSLFNILPTASSCHISLGFCKWN